MAGSLISTKRQEKCNKVRSIVNREKVKSGTKVPRRMATGRKCELPIAQPSIQNKSVQPLVGTTVWSNTLKSVVPQTVGEALFGLKNDISNAKIGYFHQKQPFLD
jgi:hypothetical protein